MFQMGRFPPSTHKTYGMQGYQKKPMSKSYQKNNNFSNTSFNPNNNNNNNNIINSYSSNNNNNIPSYNPHNNNHNPYNSSRDYKGKSDEKMMTSSSSTSSLTNENPVVIVHNLGGCLSSSDNESAFNLFSMVGKVIRIKYFISNHQKSLLIQFATPEQAQHIISVFNNRIIFGQKAAVMHSRHTYITETSHYFAQDKNTIKEYSFNPLNRCSATTATIEPTPFLMYLTEEVVTLEEISDFLTSVHAPKPKEIKVLNEKSGIIAYCDVEAALEAAALVNNGLVSDGNVIKLSFKKGIPSSSSSSSTTTSDAASPLSMDAGNENELEEGEEEEGSTAMDINDDNNNNNSGDDDDDDENDVFGDGAKHNNEDDDVNVI